MPQCEGYTPFRLPARGIRLPQDQHDFNQALSALRVTNEHTIGILKNRFPILKKMPIRITEEVESMERAVDFIEACCVLHNILLDLSENENDMEWYNNHEQPVQANVNNEPVNINNNDNEMNDGDDLPNADYVELHDGDNVNNGENNVAEMDNDINDNIIVHHNHNGMVPQQRTEQLRNNVKRYREDIINLMQRDDDNNEE
jgi:hypothetical protein